MTSHLSPDKKPSLVDAGADAAVTIVPNPSADDPKRTAKAEESEPAQEEAGAVANLQIVQAHEKDEEEEDQSEDPVESAGSHRSADFVQSNPTLRAWMPGQGKYYRFDDVRNEGPTVYGDYAQMAGSIFNFGTDDRVRLSADPIRRIKLKVATFVKPPCFDDLAQRLHRSPVAGLAGPVGSGRLSTACAALATRRGQENIREIMLPDPIDPLQLRNHQDLLQKGHGYIIRLGANTTAGLIRALERTFETHEASAVLVRDLDRPNDVLHHAEVFHRSNFDPAVMFRRHLVYHLYGHCIDDDGCNNRCGIRYARKLMKNSLLRSGVKLLTQPRECAQQAETIATRLPRSNEELAALLPSGEKRRRIRARTILETPAAEGDYQHRQLQHRRALRVAYAVFSGHPIAHVTDAAGLLLEKLDELFAHPAICRPALVHSLPVLLGNELTGDWDKEEAIGHPRPNVATRMAHVEPDMVRALLEVSWNEFDNSRPALIGWVDALATHPAEDFKNCAAVAAAGFACHDFDQVYDSMISKWAKDRKPPLRQAAAAALVAAINLAESATRGTSASDRISRQVNRKISLLAQSNAAFERDTAAKTWSMGFRPPHHSQLLRDLTYVARNANGYLGHEVAEAVARLTGDVGHAPMLVLLNRWAQSGDPTLAAAAGRSFRLLIASELPSPGRFPLLSMAGTSPQALEDTAVLWRLVLLDPDLAESGWRQLGHWLRSFRTYPPTAEAFRALLRRLVLDPSVQPRFTYWLSRAGALSPSASAA
ncbi:hypothetical protein ACWDV4_11100 [Micromonospora sp. NPDC003197]